MSERTKQVAWNFLVGFVLVELPVLTAELAREGDVDVRHLAVGLLGGLATAINRFIQTNPQGLADLHTQASEKLAASDSGSAVVPPLS